MAPSSRCAASQACLAPAAPAKLPGPQAVYGALPAFRKHGPPARIAFECSGSGLFWQQLRAEFGCRLQRPGGRAAGLAEQLPLLRGQAEL